MIGLYKPQIKMDANIIYYRIGYFSFTFLIEIQAREFYVVPRVFQKNFLSTNKE